MTRQDHLKRGSDVSPGEALLAGMISGAVSRAIIAPLDTVKIRLQLLTSELKSSPGTFKTATNIIKFEGFRALWKGNVPAELMYILYGAAQFGSYSTLNGAIADIESSLRVTIAPSIHSLLVGSGAGLFSTLTTYPLDLLRTRLAANSEREFLSMMKTVRSIAATNGLKGFFVGFGPAAVSVTANTGLMFWAYDILRTFASKYEGIPFVEGLCGFTAGLVAKAITFPLDTIRKRLQMLRASSTFELCGGIMKREGILGFYKGFGVSVLKTAPTSALSMYFYEYSLHLIKGERMK